MTDSKPTDESEATDGDSKQTDEAGEPDSLTHVEDGDAQMVDIGEKGDSRRRAVARGRLGLGSSTVGAIRADSIGKGDVLATARVGAIRAVKHTWESIPMCHQIPVTNVETEFDLDETGVTLAVTVETVGKTGCEMEALEGVTTGLNVVWDMVKSAEKVDGAYPDTHIGDVRVVEKTVER